MRRLVLLLALAVATPVQADPSARLYERALMAETDRRCGLFTPDIRAALGVGRIQARNAAVRARGDAAAVEQRARRRAAGLSCSSGDVALAASRVRAAHAGWERLTWMDFPGQTAGWRADRGRSEEIRWRVLQTAQEAQLGLAGLTPQQSDLYAIARSPRGQTPAMARLTVGRKTFLASSREPAPRPLAAPGKGRAWAFRFPPAAADALATASIRDTAELTFVAAGRGRSRAVPIEIGDYAAAQAFVRR